MRILFTLAILANAFLLFWVQLFFAKRLLPTLGGAPAIWNTCLMFYQVFLLAGYAYAVALDRLAPRRQIAVHGALIVAVTASLPFALFVWPDPGTAPPIPWLLGLLTLSLGPTFFLVASGAPLLQRWYSLSGATGGGDPYFLYAASNVGSFLALLAYPVLLEPRFTLDGQEMAWKVGYALLMVVVLGMGFRALLPRRPGGGAPVQPPSSGGLREPLTGRRRLTWVGLTFLPSSLLLGVTTQITSEIAPVPLLWVVPLALYLLTYVVAFGPARRGGAGGHRTPSARLTPFALAAAAALAVLVVGWFLTGGGLPRVEWLLVVGHLGALTAAGLICHTRLARDRPSPGRLTEFYLWIAVGGALGGVFNALVAPLLFTNPLEYPLMLAAFAFVAASGRTREGKRFRPSDLVLGALPAALLLFGTAPARAAGVEPILLLLGAGALTLVLAGRPVRFGVAVAGLVVAGFGTSAAASGEVVFRERTFYGIHRIYEDGSIRWLAHGTTIHGGQDAEDPGTPLTYYHPAGPAGSLMAWFTEEGRRGARVASIGLGTGSLLTYARPGDRWDLYELDPTVVAIAEDPRFFTYLRDTRAEYRHIVGDARIALRDEPGPYDLLVVDAFSSDAIPVHLLTVEAVELYLERLAPDGVMAFHISNRYADFSGVMGALARELGLHAMEARDTAGVPERGYYSSHWALLSRAPVTLLDPRWVPLEAEALRRRVWTDSYSSLIPILRW